MKTAHILTALAGMALLVVASGCRDKSLEASEAPVTPEAVGPTIPLNASEVDLVEKMAEHRIAYRDYLAALEQHYMRTGQYEKRKMAERELGDLKKVRQYRYLILTDVPPPQMTVASERIAEADQLYEDGLAYYKHLPLPLMYSPENMRRALEKFETIITKYPSSDKVDDAFYYAGKILKEYFEGEDLKAAEYFRRAYLADPNTPLPAHFERAAVLDLRLHDRDEALKEYRMALDADANTPGLAARTRRDFSSNRIRKLTGQD